MILSILPPFKMVKTEGVNGGKYEEASSVGATTGCTFSSPDLQAALAGQQAGMEETTPRGANEGDGPHERLILRVELTLMVRGPPLVLSTSC